MRAELFAARIQKVRGTRTGLKDAYNMLTIKILIS
jgi:hypothetical protein